MSTIPPNWVTLIWVKLWLLNSLFSHFWFLLNLQPAITIGKEKGNCWTGARVTFLYKTQSFSLLLCLLLSLSKDLLIFFQGFCTIFNSHQNQLQCALWYGMMFRWKEELFSVISLKTRIRLQVAKINDEWTQQINSNYG